MHEAPRLTTASALANLANALWLDDRFLIIHICVHSSRARRPFDDCHGKALTRPIYKRTVLAQVNKSYFLRRYSAERNVKNICPTTHYALPMTPA